MKSKKTPVSLDSRGKALIYAGLLFMVATALLASIDKFVH
jgi:hypothetical protein